MNSCDPTQNGYVPTNDFVLDQSGSQVSEVAWSGGTATLQHTNVFANGTLLASYDSQGLHFHLSDALGTRRMQTDRTGYPEQICESLPFGDQLFCTGSAQFPTEHHFTGKERDAESGLDYFGARYYSSSTGRFISPDPSSLMYADPSDPQSLNLYSYARNNPLKYTDPTGMYCYYGDPDSPSDGFDQSQYDFHSSSKECTEVDENGNKGQWINDAYTHHGRDDEGRPDHDVEASVNPPAPGTNLNYDVEVAQAQQYLQTLATASATPTARQYLQAIAQATGNFPDVCSVGFQGVAGVGPISGGGSADTKNGKRAAVSVNAVTPSGAGVSRTIRGGADGNIGYSAPIPDTPFIVTVGTQNGSLNHITSVSVGRGLVQRTSVCTQTSEQWPHADTNS